MAVVFLVHLGRLRPDSRWGRPDPPPRLPDLLLLVLGAAVLRRRRRRRRLASGRPRPCPPLGCPALRPCGWSRPLVASVGDSRGRASSRGRPTASIVGAPATATPAVVAPTWRGLVWIVCCGWSVVPRWLGRPRSLCECAPSASWWCPWRQ
jgi:hypothetical protein